MANYTVINGSRTEVTAGSTQVRRLSYRDGVAMTNAELAALLSNEAVIATSDQSGEIDKTQIKRDIRVASVYPNGLP